MNDEVKVEILCPVCGRAFVHDELIHSIGGKNICESCANDYTVAQLAEKISMSDVIHTYDSDKLFPDFSLADPTTNTIVTADTTATAAAETVAENIA